MKLPIVESESHYDDYLENDKFGGPFYGAKIPCEGVECEGCCMGKDCFHYKFLNWNDSEVRKSNL